MIWARCSPHLWTSCSRGALQRRCSRTWSSSVPATRRPADALNFQGVPDLVVEVLSPSTRWLDIDVKLPACREAGVPEVWHADPQARTFVIYGFSDDRKSYVELARGGKGDVVASRLLPGLEIEVARIFSR